MLARILVVSSLMMCLWCVGCGSSLAPQSQSQAGAAGQTNLPPLPRSSIAAVLLHREELQLTDEQVHGLQEIDEKLAAHNATLQQPPPEAKPDAGVGGGGGPGGGGRGSGFTMTGGRGGGRGGRSGAPHPAYGGGGERRGAKAIQEALDDNDTHAYLQAEELLTPEQRERAREIAEKYREDLYDRRER